MPNKVPTAQPFLLSGCSWYQGQKNNSIAWAALGSVQLYSLGFHDSFYCLRLPHPPPRGVGWETGQGVKCLLCKHQGLSSDPWHPDKKLSTVAYICDASTGQGETGIPEAYWPATSAEAVSVRSCVSRWSLTQYHTLVSRCARICRHMHRGASPTDIPYTQRVHVPSTTSPPFRLKETEVHSPVTQSVHGEPRPLSSEVSLNNKV